MDKITVYLAKTIIKMTAMVFCIVFGIYFVFTFISKLGDIGQEVIACYQPFTMFF